MTLPKINIDIAANCFFNALFREWKHWRKVTVNPGSNKEQMQIEFALPSQRVKFTLPLHYFSDLGNHSYKQPFYIDNHKTTSPVSFADAVQIIVNASELTTIVTQDKRERFIERVLSSHQFVNVFVNNRTDLKQLLTGPLNFPAGEQALLAGHSFHPAGKSREQFEGDDIDRFSPELKSQFSLCWLRVSAHSVAGVSLDITLKDRLYRAVEESAPELLHHFTDQTWVLPAHPWQWKYLQQHPSIKTLVANGDVEFLQQTGMPWLPTSSLRALYCANNSDMLKFSMNVRLTNSVRTLSVKECKRGLRLAEVMKDSKVIAWQHQYPSFRVMQEPAWAALQSSNGAVIEESLFVFRENLIKAFPEQESVVLATLAQQSPISDSNLIVERIKAVAKQRSISLTNAATLWFESFCDYVVKPLFAAHSELGLVFLAHQQNIVVQLNEGLPAGMYFRDCQGTGFSDLAIKTFAHLPEKTVKNAMENHWSDTQIARYFPYYTLINSCFAVVSALASGHIKNEAYWSHLLATSLESLVPKAKDQLCLSRVLNQEKFECKGNFFCYLHDHNENTLVDPSEIYFSLENPLVKETEYA